MTKNCPNKNSELSKKKIGSRLVTPATAPNNTAAKKLKYGGLWTSKGGTLSYSDTFKLKEKKVICHLN
tara:strand:- start:4689 stop:4892 length:204 start_codon:yes stop_codon:yes gene_type:complete